MDSQLTLSLTTRLLHWVIALGFIGLSLIGIYMANTETWWLYHWHKSLGVLLFGIILLRVIWRLWRGWPVAIHKYQLWEQQLAKITHWILLLGTIAMPITGMMYSGGSGNGFGIFGWRLMEATLDPTNPDMVIPYSETLEQIGETSHEIIGYTLVIAIVLHIAGAIKHHVFDKDGTLLRMLGK